MNPKFVSNKLRALQSPSICFYIIINKAPDGKLNLTVKVESGELKRGDHNIGWIKRMSLVEGASAKNEVSVTQDEFALWYSALNFETKERHKKDEIKQALAENSSLDLKCNARPKTGSETQEKSEYIYSIDIIIPDSTKKEKDTNKSVLSFRREIRLLTKLVEVIDIPHENVRAGLEGVDIDSFKINYKTFI